MEIVKFDIEGPLLIKPRIFEDERGYFYESFNHELFRKNKLETNFVQDNQSLSFKGVLRGLHFQNPPFAQGKLVRVVFGSVYDMIIDIRPSSPTYKKCIRVELSSANKYLFWIPPGFAHGFLTLENNTVFLYKCTQLYNKESESGILWNDKELGLDWGISDPVISEKDLQLPSLRNTVNKFQ